MGDPRWPRWQQDHLVKLRRSPASMQSVAEAIPTFRMQGGLRGSREGARTVSEGVAFAQAAEGDSLHDAAAKARRRGSARARRLRASVGPCQQPKQARPTVGGIEAASSFRSSAVWRLPLGEEHA
jgi:hypothetical protein